MAPKSRSRDAPAPRRTRERHPAGRGDARSGRGRPRKDPRVRERAPRRSAAAGARASASRPSRRAGSCSTRATHRTVHHRPPRRRRVDRAAGGRPPRAVPDDWRFLLVRPDADPGRSGDAEDDAMRTAVERAGPGLADRIGGIVTRRVLPAIATGNAERFGAAVAEIGRLNGAWYADEQGGSTARRSATWSHRCRTPRPCSAPGSRRGADRIRNHGRRERDCGRERGAASAPSTRRALTGRSRSSRRPTAAGRG